ncbi:MAG: patatin-like phospholipase family protein, partial [Candidatus Margulisiibacteriota bacterium]
ANGTIASLDNKAFEQILMDSPEIGLRIYRTLAHRLSNKNNQLIGTPNTNIVTIISKDYDPCFISAITDGLIKHEKTVRMLTTPEKIDEHFLDDLKKGKNTDIQLIYLRSPITKEQKRIISISNKVISFGYRPNYFKKVFTLPAKNKMRFTDSVVRNILGKSVGLALSSGAAHGLTHLGVLKVLKEEGVTIDMIAGTSGGALYGIPYAMGISREKQEHTLKNLYRKKNFNLLDLNILPFQGIIKGRRIIDKALHSLIGNKTFEDLDIPFLAMSTDITQARERILWQGNINDAVRASISIPAIFDPIRRNNCLLVDGVVTTPVPVEPLLDFGVDKVIAVFVGGVNHFCKAKPGILDIFMRARSVASDRIAAHNYSHADLVIKPDTSNIGCFEYEKVESLIEIGARAAKKMLPAIKALTD